MLHPSAEPSRGEHAAAPHAAPSPAPAQEDLALYAQAALHALAREELAERRPHRLLEDNRATWTRFRGRLDSLALLELLLEDAAVTQPSAFDIAVVFDRSASLSALSAELVDGWLEALSELDLRASSADYIAAQAKRLGLPTRMARSDLRKIESHQRVLELPGTGGQLAHHIIQMQPDLILRNIFTIACTNWRDKALAGFVGVDCGVSGPMPIVFEPNPDLSTLRKAKFDHVIGLSPEHGGPFDPAAHTEWFDGAAILLV